MTLGPLPTIVERPYEPGDIVVYDGFVFEVDSTEDDFVHLKHGNGQDEFVPSSFISLL